MLLEITVEAYRVTDGRHHFTY